VPVIPSAATTLEWPVRPHGAVPPFVAAAVEITLHAALVAAHLLSARSRELQLRCESCSCESGGERIAAKGLCLRGDWDSGGAAPEPARERGQRVAAGRARVGAARASALRGEVRYGVDRRSIQVDDSGESISRDPSPPVRVVRHDEAPRIWFRIAAGFVARTAARSTAARGVRIGVPIVLPVARSAEATHARASLLVATPPNPASNLRETPSRVIPRRTRRDRRWHALCSTVARQGGRACRTSQGMTRDTRDRHRGR
jgi:hypothetical protein